MKIAYEESKSASCKLHAGHRCMYVTCIPNYKLFCILHATACNIATMCRLFTALRPYLHHVHLLWRADDMKQDVSPWLVSTHFRCSPFHLARGQGSIWCMCWLASFLFACQDALHIRPQWASKQFCSACNGQVLGCVNQHRPFVLLCVSRLALASCCTSTRLPWVVTHV